MIKVAVVGCGYWGPNLIRNFYELESCELAMVCDMEPSRLAPVERAYPTVATTTDFQQVLESKEVAGVAIATPARTHYALARQALLYGKHVLIEKPLALSSHDCEELIRLAAQQDRVLMVGHTFLYNPALTKVKELMSPDYLGDVYYLYSQRVNLGRVQTDLNALWSIAPHDVSISLYLLDNLPTGVSARGARYLNDKVEDVVFLTLTFPGGVVVNTHVSWLDPSKVRRFTVVGSRRMIVYDDIADEGKVKVYDKGVFKDPNQQLFGEFHYRLHSGDIYAPQIAMTEPLANECAHFVDCIRSGKRPLSDGENGLQVVRVLEAAQKSMTNHGMSVSLSPEHARA